MGAFERPNQDDGCFGGSGSLLNLCIMSSVNASIAGFPEMDT